MTNGEQSKQQTPARTPWLAQARRQARSEAQRRSSHPRSFDWQAVEVAPTRGWLQRLVPGSQLRLSWALTALALVVLGGGGALLAYVHLQQGQRSTAPSGRHTLAGQSQRQLSAPGAKTRAVQPVVSPVELRQTKPVKAKPAPVVAPKPAPRRPRKLARQQAPAKKAEPKPDSGLIPPAVLKIPGTEVIIVRPPPRYVPLWRPEDYKKGGPRGSNW